MLSSEDALREGGGDRSHGASGCMEGGGGSGVECGEGREGVGKATMGGAAFVHPIHSGGCKV